MWGVHHLQNGGYPMITFKVEFSEEGATALKDAAQRYNVTPEEYIARKIEAGLRTDPSIPVPKAEEDIDAKFDAIVEDLLVERRWLYEQLAKGPDAS
jgi:hypothetical protein